MIPADLLHECLTDPEFLCHFKQWPMKTRLLKLGLRLGFAAVDKNIPDNSSGSKWRVGVRCNIRIRVLEGSLDNGIVGG